MNKATQGSAATYSPLAYERIQWDGLHARRSFEISGADNRKPCTATPTQPCWLATRLPGCSTARNTLTAFKWRVSGGLLSCQLPAFRDMRCAGRRLE